MFVPTAVVMTGLITVSAVGASALPGFIWGYGDPLLCGTPRPTETREAIAAEAKRGPLALRDAARGRRVLLVGDSTACSLWPGLNAVGNAAGIATDQGSVFGCGVASGEITTTRNEAITPHSSRCPALVDSDESKALARARPTLVIWMSIWEKSDLVVDGKTVVAGTPAGEKEIMARMDAALARLTAGGAHVALVTEAAPAPNPAQGTLTTSTKADNDGYVRLNALLRRFQARHRRRRHPRRSRDEAVPVRSAVPGQGRRTPRAPRRTALHPDRGHVGGALHPHADVRDEMTAVLAPADDAPEAQPVSRWRRIGLAAPAYLPALMIAIGGWQHRWMDEDAFINLRIVDQIFAGHGPVFNAGERVEAATSTIWIGVLVIGRLLFGSFASMEWITLLASLAAAVARVRDRGEGDAPAAPRRRRRRRSRRADPRRVGRGRLGLLDVGARDGPRLVVDRGLVVRARVGRAHARRCSGRKRFGFGVILGLAPLVRPDLALMMLCFVAAWFVLVRPRRIMFDLVAIFALPVAYQIFRMGYYATVVPTTALAKDASGLHLGQGWTYAKNFIVPYRLWLSAIVIVAAIVYRFLANRDRRLAIATAAMLAAGLVHALYITAIGGDYMHGRLLLPAFFALALPASLAVPIAARSRRTVWVSGIAAFAVVWALVSVAAFRPPPNTKSYLLSPISDSARVSGAKLKPIDSAFGLNGNEAAAAYAQGVRGYFKLTDKEPRPALDPDAFVLTTGVDRRARVRRGPPRLGHRHRRPRGTARGAHRARTRPTRRATANRSTTRGTTRVSRR